MRDYRTTQTLRQGQSGEILRIPVIEGELERADRNRLVGVLPVNGEEIRRDLPAGSEVEATLRIDESRIITVTAYIPLLDEEFALQLNMKHDQPNPKQLKEDYEAEMKRFRDVKAKARDTGGESVDHLVQSIESSPLMEEVKVSVVAAQGDPDAAAICEKRLLELKLKLDEAADALEWPALRAEVRQWLKDLDNVVNQHGSGPQRERANQLVDEIEDLIAKRQADRLRKKLDQVIDLYWDIVTAQPGFWVYQFGRLEKQQHKMSDQSRAARLLDQGRECLAKNNLLGLQNIVRHLWDLLPREEAEAAQRGYQSGIVR
jgi:molecular chaperone DnaK